MWRSEIGVGTVQFEDEDRFNLVVIGFFSGWQGQKATTVGFFDERIGNDGHVF